MLKSIEKLFPKPLLAPAAVSGIDRFPMREALRQLPPYAEHCKLKICHHEAMVLLIEDTPYKTMAQALIMRREGMVLGGERGRVGDLHQARFSDSRLTFRFVTHPSTLLWTRAEKESIRLILTLPDVRSGEVGIRGDANSRCLSPAAAQEQGERGQ